ncbi:leucyl aminopeptidase family protein [Polymorphum gilvum]|uniref:Peptidase M17, leucyl aminopeptidase-like protein n=1 Tax=Polymorphum gilvum (strain LMG 25793 / CGMCC 1.9160 / SL003B-26A1) TaxID=991905 RepID=F2J2Q3_POLGS|nr:leucyl aminopeptidase family protein [Polymorphum gilvum]ADZ72077.1 Peptidase M17, leucyl aminopeptidase-like protein [Polymorphum gilvum SL003B-26A1]
MSDSLLALADAVSPVSIHAVCTRTLADRLSQLGQGAADWATLQGYKAAAGTVLVLPGDAERPQAVLFGVPETGQGTGQETGQGTGLGDTFAAGALVAALPAGDYCLAEGFPDPERAALGFALSSYRFTRYRSAEARPLPRLVIADGDMLARLRRIGAGVALARDLINTPSNDMGPAELAEAAVGLFARHGGTAEVIVGDDLLKQGFPMIHAVGRASNRAPRLIDCRWGEAAHPKVTLVGKGVVFDTGGLDIKPSSSMLLMKKDMGGAANVLGLAAMIMDAGLPIRLRVLIPAVENAISGSAFRPGDILPSRKGLSVEIGNTDAEGRLVLADALALADEEEPDLIVDMATLTGAARVALGPDLPPVYTDDEDLALALAAKAEAENDPLWRLPLWQPYMKYLDSKIADINHVNTSGAGYAGSITAALFLSRFVEKAKAWAHFDIFAWTPIERPGKPTGGEAQGIRALFALLQERYPGIK